MKQINISKLVTIFAKYNKLIKLKIKNNYDNMIVMFYGFLLSFFYIKGIHISIDLNSFQDSTKILSLDIYFLDNKFIYLLLLSLLVGVIYVLCILYREGFFKNFKVRFIYIVICIAIISIFYRQATCTRVNNSNFNGLSILVVLNYLVNNVLRLLILVPIYRLFFYIVNLIVAKCCSNDLTKYINKIVLNIEKLIKFIIYIICLNDIVNNFGDVLDIPYPNINNSNELIIVPYSKDIILIAITLYMIKLLFYIVQYKEKISKKNFTYLLICTYIIFISINGYMFGKYYMSMYKPKIQIVNPTLAHKDEIKSNFAKEKMEKELKINDEIVKSSIDNYIINGITCNEENMEQIYKIQEDKYYKLMEDDYKLSKDMLNIIENDRIQLIKTVIIIGIRGYYEYPSSLNLMGFIQFIIGKLLDLIVIGTIVAKLTSK